MPNLLKQAMLYESPATLPVSANLLPAAWMKYGAELQRLVDQYPQFFGGRKVDLDHIGNITPASYHAGSFADEWGCVWTNIDAGMESIVTGHPIQTEDDIRNLMIPPNKDGRIPHGFMYLRLLDLCGFEFAMSLFAEEGEEIQMLIDKVLEYNCIQIEAVGDFGEIAYFGDDLGMQNSLAIGPERWRKYMKPCFKKMYDIAKSKRKDALVYMHTDGCIWEIMPDLVECGVDMLNPQYRSNGLDNLVRVCKGKIPINLDLDRQLFPFATRSELFDHVGECVESLYLPAGGLGLNIEFNYEIPLENMAAVLDAAEKYRFYK